jgi:hypothetical protein
MPRLSCSKLLGVFKSKRLCKKDGKQWLEIKLVRDGSRDGREGGIRSCWEFVNCGKNFDIYSE